MPGRANRAVDPLPIRAEMARRQLLAGQRDRWWSPDSEQIVNPQEDPEVIAEAFQFLTWPERRLLDAERGGQ